MKIFFFTVIWPKKKSRKSKSCLVVKLEANNSLFSLNSCCVRQCGIVLGELLRPLLFQGCDASRNLGAPF